MTWLLFSLRGAIFWRRKILGFSDKIVFKIFNLFLSFFKEPNNEIEDSCLINFHFFHFLSTEREPNYLIIGVISLVCYSC